MEPQHRHHHKFDPANAARLLSEERAQMLPPARVLELLDAQPGDIAADIGCGPGFFALPLAQRVTAQGGRVLACDTSPAMLDILRRRALEAGGAAVETLLSEESRLPLADGACDRVLLACLLHELESPESFLAEVRRVLRPGGRGLAVDWQARETPVGPPPASRVPPDMASAWLAAAGLTAAPAVDVGPYSYGIVFHRPGAGRVSGEAGDGPGAGV